MSHDHPDMVPRDSACEYVLDLRSDHLQDHPAEYVPIDKLAGRTLATDIVASEDSPARSHATMDGFAFDARSKFPLELVDREVFPEDDPGEINIGQAIRIATGAPLPGGTNAVMKREDAEIEDGLVTGPDIDVGTYVYERGTNVEADESVFSRGERLASKDAIFLRDIGHEEVRVYERLDVGILATGTEIHEDVHSDLDSPMLANLVRSWGHTATLEGSVPDTADIVRTRIAELAESYDVVITTGGTSVGHKDHVIASLDDLGEVLFHRVKIRPGKPIAAARLPDHDAIAFAIPGKPVGAYVISTLVMGPFFTGSSGSFPTIDAELSCDIGLGPSGFEYVIPVTLRSEQAIPLGHTTSPLTIYEDVFDPSVLSSATRASRADGFVITKSDIEAGTTVDVIPARVLE